MSKHRIQTLKPRITTVCGLSDRIKDMPRKRSKTLAERRAETGRTLALDGAAWRRLRAAVLSEQPVCRHCEARGYVVVATDVDHVDNDSTNNARNNLQSLCRSCHSLKTAADAGKDVYLGCDLNGMPLDPQHPWNNE